MNAFEWIDVRSIEEAASLLSSGTGTVVAKAGGIDLIDLMKEGLLKPNRVINLHTIAGLGDVELDAQGSLRLGALATLAQIARDPNVVKQYGALAAAAEHAATPQVRNVATIGGNLLQRPRCWYFRNEHFERAAVNDAARDGQNQYHAIFDADKTPLVHASTPATALLAYDATIHVLSTQGKRSIAIRELFLPPDPTRSSDVSLHRGEVLTHITLPTQPGSAISAYRKQTERDSYDWPICDVAVVLQLKADRTVAAASIALGWVAPTPIRATAAESLLLGHSIDETRARLAARAAVSTARPLARNAYKVQVLETVIQRTIMDARL
jgi:xanthine dehydrogenase YagS FAD-binding subunit